MDLKFVKEKFINAKKEGNDATLKMRSAYSKAAISAPAGFPSASSVTSTMSKVKTVCSKADDLDNVYNKWENSSEKFELKSELPSQIEFEQLITDPTVECILDFDKNVVIVVTHGAEAQGDIKYELPLDLYVMSVMDGEHLLMHFISGYYNNTAVVIDGVSYLPTYEQLIEGFKACSIIVRSYTIYNTVDSEKHSEDLRINGAGNNNNKQVSTDRLITGNHNYRSEDLALQFGLKAAVETTGMVLTTPDGKVAPAYFTGKFLNRCMKYAFEGCNYQEALEKAIEDVSKWTSSEKGWDRYATYREDLQLSYWDSETRSVVGPVPADDMISRYIDKNLPDGVKVDKNTQYKLSDSVIVDLEQMQRERRWRKPIKVDDENVNVSNPTPYLGGSGEVGNISLNPNISQKENILPLNKFSDVIPQLNVGKVSDYEISTNHVKYNIENITSDSYANYINLLIRDGYKLSDDGITWLKGNYKILLQRDGSNQMQIYVSTLDNI